MALLADIRLPSRSSIDMAASAIAAILGLSGLLMFYHGYAGFPELALPAGAGLVLAALVVGAQGYRRTQARHLEDVDEGIAMMRAIADALPDAVTVKNLKGELVFANAAARSKISVLAPSRSSSAVCAEGPGRSSETAPMEQAGTEKRLPWRDRHGQLLGWMEICSASQVAASMPALVPQVGIEAAVEQRTAQVRELLADMETSREDERKALARRVHGDLGSSLTALSMHLAILSRHLPDDEVFRERMKQMKDLLNAAAKTTRGIQSTLRPDKLDLFGLKVAVEDLADQLSDSTGIACELHFPDEPVTYSARLEIAFYRMLEEALRNITSHAYATQVDITLDDDADYVSLCIRDNGVGFSPADVPAGAHGLCRIRERAAYLGGSLSIHSSPGLGTTLCIRLPRQLRPEPQEG